MTPDLVVVGAGTVGGWAGWFASRIGARVTVLERHTAGQGASSRAAGIVRAQGGTPTAVALGRWSIDFYERQQSLIGTDSGFRRLGYLLLARTDAEAAEARSARGDAAARGAGRALGLAGGGGGAESHARARTGSWARPTAPTEGCIDPPRNVRAYVLALQRAGVELRERCDCEELLVEDGRVVGVRAGGETIACSRVILTGGPSLRDTARRLGFTVFAGGARHQVAVTSPHPDFAGEPLPMVFDLTAGVYWRQEEDGLLFGWSDPDERPGEAREVSFEYLESVRGRLARDGARHRGPRPAQGLGGHDRLHARPPADPGLAGGGPGDRERGRARDDVGTGRGPRGRRSWRSPGAPTWWTCPTSGLDRFDSEGRSRLATDPIALPFPSETERPPHTSPA